MSINTWTPDNELEKQIPDPQKVDLQTWVSIGASDDIENKITQLSNEVINTLTPLMKQADIYWQTAAGNLSGNDIRSLIRFFALAEEKHSQLFTGQDSPVIALNKMLKQRKTPLSKEDLLWIKKHSSNRYLPNGSIF